MMVRNMTNRRTPRDGGVDDDSSNENDDYQKTMNGRKPPNSAMNTAGFHGNQRCFHSVASVGILLLLIYIASLLNNLVTLFSQSNLIGGRVAPPLERTSTNATTNLLRREKDDRIQRRTERAIEALERMQGKFSPQYRSEWAMLITGLELETGAEVGVWEGDFAEKVLSTVPTIQTYYLVDPWAHLDDWNKPFNVEDEKFTKVFNTAMKKTKDNPKYGHKVKVLRDRSSKAAPRVPDKSLDFVYIDGDHTAKGATTDLACWVGKVRSGGLLLGDDYLDSKQHGDKFDPTIVKSIVDGFAEALGSNVYLMGGNQWGIVVP